MNYEEQKLEALRDVAESLAEIALSGVAHTALLRRIADRIDPPQRSFADTYPKAAWPEYDR